MEHSQRTEYLKRTQKDYSMSFKLQVVQEVECGEVVRCFVARWFFQQRLPVLH